MKKILLPVSDSLNPSWIRSAAKVIRSMASFIMSCIGTRATLPYQALRLRTGHPWEGCQWQERVYLEAY